MAHGSVLLENKVTLQTKSLPTGYSWTTLFFGAIPALFRMDWKNAAIIAGTCILLSLLLGTIVGIIAGVVFSFIYNDKMCLADHLKNGWQVMSYTGVESLEQVSSSVGVDVTRNKSVHLE